MDQLAAPPHPISGVIEKITFYNPDTGFAVLRVRNEKGAGTLTVVGCVPLVHTGDHVECAGDWINDRTYGVQFRADRIDVAPPQTAAAMLRYLSAGVVPGIGPKLAEQLVSRFGERVFDILEHEPDRLGEIPGMGKKKRAKIIEGWQRERAARDVVVFLQSHGIGPARAMRVYKAYGDLAIAKIRQNPYVLARDIDGIGFKTADAIAQSCGIAPDAPGRLEAGLREALRDQASSGHCLVAENDLLNLASKLLAVEAPLLTVALESLCRQRELIADETDSERSFYLASLYRAETGVTEHMERLLSYPASVHIDDIDEALREATRLTCLQLSPSQESALRLVVTGKVAVITGGPGVGKTTVLNTLLTMWRAEGARVLLGAPTGRAAKRLSEATGLEAKTLHRLLEYDPRTMVFKRGEGDPLEVDLIVVDEVSMVDIVLMLALVRGLPDTARLVLVGDVDQLPSVGPGNVLADVINSGCAPTARLTEIFRQSASSQIIVNAHRINRGEMPMLDNETDTDFFWIPAQSPDEIFSKLMHVVVERIPQRFHVDPKRDIQVLTPMNKGGLGTKALNVELQQRLNHHDDVPTIQHHGWTFIPGDKVIQTVNNYDKEVFNGDMGYIEYLDSANLQMKINFDGRSVEYERDSFDEINLAYATTVHKSQGSEYPVVVIPLSTQHYTLLERNLLYTAITRGKRLVVVIGQLRALQLAVENVRARHRVTKLAERLRQLCA